MAGRRRLVGRFGERRLLAHLLRDARRGHASVAVLVGPAGAGKTALLRWTADAARAGGAEVLWTSGYEAGVPFSALRRLLGPLGAAPGLLEAAAGDAAARGEPPTDDLPGRITEVLVAHARRRPLVVVVDDVHDLGRASGAVLDYVLASLDDAGARHPLDLMAVLGAREPVDAGSLAERALRLDSARAVAVRGLDERDVFELVAAAGQETSPPRVAALLADTGGLPLLLESALDPGAGPGDRSHPRVRSLADALRVRLGRVDGRTRALLAEAAILGEPWQPGELPDLLGRPAAEVEAALTAGREAGLVAAGEGGLACAHPLVRAELLDGVGGDRRRALHLACAARLRAARGGEEDVRAVQVADHLLRAGPAADPEEVAAAAQRAGRIALGWRAWSSASRLLSAAAAVLADRLAPADLARRELEAGVAAYYDHDSERCEQLWAAAIAHATAGGDGTVRLRAALLLARMRGNKPFRPGDRIDVSELTAALASEPEVDVALRVEAEAALAEALIVAGDAERALDIVAGARRVAAGAPGASVDGALGRVDFAEGIHRQSRLELEAADGCFAAGAERSRRVGDAGTANLAASRRALDDLLRGDVGRARTGLGAAAAEARALGLWGEAGFDAALLAFAATLVGGADAEEHIDDARRQWRRTRAQWIAVVLAGVVPCRAAQLRGLGDAASDPADGVPLSSAAAALAAVEAGDAPGAAAAVRRAGWRAGVRGRVSLRTTGLAVALVEVGDLLGDPRMVAAARPALEELDEAGVLVTLGWPATVPRLLAVACRHAGDLDGARRHTDHARGLAEREGLAPERGKALLEAARLAAAAGQPDAAGGLLAAAVAGFDAAALPGWVARAHEVGHTLRLAPLAGPEGVRQERTIFTDDVVGSTASNVRLGDALYLEQLRVHDRLVRARLRQFRGLEIKHTGDGVNAAFDDPAAAVECARALAVDFAAWRADEPDLALRIRCGLARGSVIPSGGDFFGVVQAEAARLCALAGPAEILASAAVVEGCGPAVATESLGPRALRGLPSAVEVFRIVA